MTLCIHELDADKCIVCKVAGAEPMPEQIDYAFDAKYEDECSGCPDPILPGQFAVKMKPSGQYLHRSCAPENPRFA